MREAVIVSTARTPLAKSHRGEFNVTPAAQLAAFSVKAAVERSGIDPAMIEDLVLGCGNPDGFQGRNLGRQAVLRAELPLSIAGMTIARYCASGLQSIAMASSRIVAEGVDAMIAGGVETISGIRAGNNLPTDMDPWLVEHKPE
ncbi:MAG: beta-ketoacyl synthase N-terminal-like domain-containing protein, partial [Comamonas sp.]